MWLYTIFSDYAYYLYIDDFVGPEIYVPTDPVFSLTPDVSEWDFGQVDTNTPATKTFTVSNAGGGTLVVSDITVSDTGFSLTQPFT